jgi:transcriptional regulator with XRE-family HTH domain
MDDFIKRLEMILEFYGLSASVFADKMGVQRSGLSHLMSGRNKPSLDFVMKIVENFPDVDFYWLLNGEGNFPKSETAGTIVTEEKTIVTPTLFPSVETSPIDLFSSEATEPLKENKIETDLFSQTVEEAKNKPADISEAKRSSKIERIVIFYTNGTFKEYAPEN